jgi:oligopeptide transport system ATP-binding protein
VMRSGSNGDEIMVQVENLSKTYKVRTKDKTFWGTPRLGALKALTNVSFSIYKGETLGLVGESGCGKTTLGRVLLRLTAGTEGKVLVDGQDVYSLNKRELCGLRRKMQMIFQNPYAALSNHMRVREIIAEAVRLNGNMDKAEIETRVRELIADVNLHPSKLDQFAFELSGGERRRVGIARIFAVSPEFIVADEPVAALDVSIKAQIINLLQDLKEKHGLTYLFISHDIGMVKYVSDRIAVMYMGKIVELGLNRAVRRNRCSHPYTFELLSAAAYMVKDWEEEERAVSQSDGLDSDWDVPDHVPSGCPYHPRCPIYKLKQAPDCRDKEPELQSADSRYGGVHWVACHFPGEINAGIQRG